MNPNDINSIDPTLSMSGSDFKKARTEKRRKLRALKTLMQLDFDRVQQAAKSDSIELPKELNPLFEMYNIR